MSLLKTPLPNTDFTAPEFNLQGVDGSHYQFKDVKGPKGTVILFICNHCPYVRGIVDRLVEDLSTLQDEGFGACAIMPNDTENYPDDSFENMKIFADKHNFSFPYVIDETQNVAREYGAICTPDIFGFNKDGKLQYRGRLDSAGPNAKQDGLKKELVAAMRDIAETGEGPEMQNPSIGCSIKWRA